MGLNINLTDVICNAHNSITDSLDDIINELNVLKLNQDVIINKMTDINTSINNITNITPPTEPDPGPTEPEPEKVTLSIVDSNINNTRLTINDVGQSLQDGNVTREFNIMDKIKISVRPLEYMVFDNAPQMYIIDDNNQSVIPLSVNGEFYSVSLTLTTSVNIKIIAPARLQPFNEDNINQPYDPLHPDTPDYINNTYKVWFDDLDMPPRPTENCLELKPSNRGLYGSIPVPAGCKILKLYSTINCDTEIFINNNLTDTLTYGQYLYFDNEVTTLDICIPDYSTGIMGNINIIYTPRTDISISDYNVGTTINSNSIPMDNYIAAYTTNPVGSNYTVVFQQNEKNNIKSGSNISMFHNNTLLPCKMSGGSNTDAHLILIKKEGTT